MNKQLLLLVLLWLVSNEIAIWLGKVKHQKLASNELMGVKFPHSRDKEADVSIQGAVTKASSDIVPDSNKCVLHKHSESGSLVEPENGNSLIKEISFFMTQINMRTFSTTTFIVQNRSFIFIGSEKV